MEDVYVNLQKFAEQLLGMMNKTSSKKEFLNLWDEKQFESLREHLGYCFYKVNELSYHFLEKNEVPAMEQCLFAFSIAAIAHKIDLWDGGNDSPFFHYSEFAKGKLTKESAKEILKNQKTIDNFSNAIYYSWSEVHNRGVFTEIKKVG